MEMPVRKNLRLQNFDYSSNAAYFITVCIRNKSCTLGSIVGEGSPLPRLSDQGMICDRLINELEIKYPAIKLDNYVIMPNHIHLLLSVDEANGRGDPSPTISQLMGWFKYQATKEINGITKSGEKVFQRSFYDHVVRNQRDYREIWEYIDSNPAKWKIDKLYCEN